MARHQVILELDPDAALPADADLGMRRMYEGTLKGYQSLAEPNSPPVSRWGLTDPSLLRGSGPVTIHGDAEVPESGVIENLDVEGPITIVRTTRPLLIRNCRARVVAGTHDAIRIGTYNVPSDGCSNVRISNCSLQAPTGYGIAVRDGSQDILAALNEVTCGGGSVWQYAYHCARNVRRVVFDSNYALYRGSVESVGVNLGDYWLDDATMARELQANNNTIEGFTVSGIVFSGLLSGRAAGNTIRFAGVPRGMRDHAGAPRCFAWEDGSEDCWASQNVLEDANAIGFIWEGSRPVRGSRNGCVGNTLRRVDQPTILNQAVEPDFVFSSSTSSQSASAFGSSSNAGRIVEA